MARTPAEIAKIRAACQLVSDTLADLNKRIHVGVTPLELDKAAEAFIRGHGGKPAFKGYQGYPANICVSVNCEVVHGIPDKRMLRYGDLVSVDIGVELDGYFGDSAFTFVIGQAGANKRLINTTLEALYAGIAQAKKGKFSGDIGFAVQTIVEERGYNVVRELCGHGVGTSLHEPPEVPNFGQPGQGTQLEAGMVIAIEPMVNVGTWQTRRASDGWTILTKDRKLSAHFEHTVVVTDGEPEILTHFEFGAVGRAY